MSSSLEWCAWLGLASLASAWLVSLAATTTTATIPKQGYQATAAVLLATAVVVDACSGAVAIVVAAAEASLAKPSQASQSREALTNGIRYFCD